MKPIMGQAPKGNTQKPTCQLPHKLQQRQLPQRKKKQRVHETSHRSSSKTVYTKPN